MTTAYIALGANLGDRAAEMSCALKRLDRYDRIRVMRCSPLYETEPVGMPEGTPAFLNSVAEIDANLGPRSLLKILMEVEREGGRERNGVAPQSRSIDLDLLIYGDCLIDEPGLLVPHPRMTKRRFVLEPLADLAPSLLLPGAGSTIESILRELNDSSRCERVARQPAWINP